LRKAVLKMIKTEVLRRPLPVVGPPAPLPEGHQLDAAVKELIDTWQAAHKAVMWLTKPDKNWPFRPVVGDTALKLAIIVKKLGLFTSKMCGPQQDRSDWGLLYVAAMKHSGVLGSVVRDGAGCAPCLHVSCGLAAQCGADSAQHACLRLAHTTCDVADWKLVLVSRIALSPFTRPCGTKCS